MDESHRERKRKRCFQRVISGLERGGQIRFITLTSAPDSPADIQRSWRKLIMRLKRRNLVTGYIKVPETTQSGLVHYHVLCRGSYVEQLLLSKWWQDIHGAKVVDIRQVAAFSHKAQVAAYVAKYMSKDAAGRYSWDWGWVWRGFCHDWQTVKRLAYYAHQYGHEISWPNIMHIWRQWLHSGIEPPLRQWAAALGHGVYDKLYPEVA